MFANDLGLQDISFDLDDLGRRLIDPTSTIGLVFQSEQSQSSMHELCAKLHAHAKLKAVLAAFRIRTLLKFVLE